MVQTNGSYDQHKDYYAAFYLAVDNPKELGPERWCVVLEPPGVVCLRGPVGEEGPV